MKKIYSSNFAFGIIPVRLYVPNITVNYRLAFCFLLLFISHYTFCQKLSPEVISSAGDVSKTASISLEWTLGETVVESSKTANKYYTQGFHQTFLKVFPTNNESLASDYSMTVFPNPVEATLEIKMSNESLPQDYTGKVDLFLIDIRGLQISVQKTNEKSGSTFLDMTTLPSGTYFLKAQKENGLLLKTFKIVKVK